MGRKDAIVANQQKMVTTLDELGQRQRHPNTDFNHFARQIGLNEAYFEQRFHDHDKELFEQEIPRKFIG